MPSFTVQWRARKGLTEHTSFVRSILHFPTSHVGLCWHWHSYLAHSSCVDNTPYISIASPLVLAAVQSGTKSTTRPLFDVPCLQSTPAQSAKYLIRPQHHTTTAQHERGQLPQQRQARGSSQCRHLLPRLPKRFATPSTIIPSSRIGVRSTSIIRPDDEYTRSIKICAGL